MSLPRDPQISKHIQEMYRQCKKGDTAEAISFVEKAGVPLEEVFAPGVLDASAGTGDTEKTEVKEKKEEEEVEDDGWTTVTTKKKGKGRGHSIEE